jgi:hypothetical protein
LEKLIFGVKCQLCIFVFFEQWHLY